MTQDIVKLSSEDREWLDSLIRSGKATRRPAALDHARQRPVGRTGWRCVRACACGTFLHRRDCAAPGHRDGRMWPDDLDKSRGFRDIIALLSNLSHQQANWCSIRAELGGATEASGRDPDHGHRDHRDTISPSGTMWLDGVPGENAGFGGSRPLPALATAVDAIAPAQVGQTATADNAVATTGNPGGTIMTSQTQSNSSSAGLIIDAVYDSSISMANLGTTLYDQVTGAITAAIDF